MKIATIPIIILPFRLLQIRTFYIVLIVIQIHTQPVYSQTKPELVNSDAINKTLRGIVNSGKVPGMIAAIISNESVIAIGTAGVRKTGSNIAITSNDLSHLGSCTKAMTSAMLTTLVAEGKLRWEMKLTEAIPELKSGIHPDFQYVTLWQLLTHRAGIPKNPTDEGAFSSKEIKKRRLAIIEDNFKSPSYYKIDKFNYSNFGYMIAACMAEQVTGLSWEVLMKQRLFDPLGMTSAGFGNPNKNKSTDQPWGHHKNSLEWWSSESYYSEAGSPAGDIYCNIADWAKFISLQLSTESPILERKYLDKLIEPPEGFYAGGWGIAEYKWAKGITLSHSGTNEIWYTQVIVAPMLDRAYVVVTNSCDFGVTEDICSDMILKLINWDL